MATYQTEQKRLLIDFLKKHSEKAFTIDEISEKMKAEYSSEVLPGRSTLYRLIPKLLSEGVIKRFTKEGSRKAYFQIMDGKNCDRHLHLKCTSCGKLVHMSTTASEEVFSTVLNENHFSVNREQTVLFGECADCKYKDN